MDKGKFHTSVHDCISFLKEFGMLKDSNPSKVDGFSQEYMDVSRSGDYFKIYDVVTKNFDYTILLKDDSFFQFHIDGDNGGYIFMQNPRLNKDLSEFIKEFYEDGNVPEEDMEIILDSYDEYLNEDLLNNRAVYMRLDFDEKTYNKFIHSFAHLHINVNSDIRIPFDKVLSPLAFSTFVLKHVYHKRWKDEERKDYFPKYKNKLREILMPHPKEFWDAEDQLNLFIT